MLKLVRKGMSRSRSTSGSMNSKLRLLSLKGRSEAIAYKQQGADALRNLNETLAAIIARAGFGEVDPASGSAATMQMFALSEGSMEAAIAQDNAVLALGGSLHTKRHL